MRKTFRKGVRLLFGLPLAVISGLAAPSIDEARISFRFPEAVTLCFQPPSTQSAPSGKDWFRGRREDGSGPALEFGDRVVLQVRENTPWETLVKDRPLKISRQVTSNLFIFQAPDAWTAVQEAGRLATLAGVRAAYPVMRREAALDGAYAPRPNDPHFPPLLANVIGQWYLENRNETNGASLGP